MISRALSFDTFTDSTITRCKLILTRVKQKIPLLIILLKSIHETSPDVPGFSVIKDRDLRKNLRPLKDLLRKTGGSISVERAAIIELYVFIILE